MDAFSKGIPKAELHLHIEGTLEPEMMFELANRNGVPLRFKSVEEVRAAYEFSDLQSFLDIYYEGARVLLKERDFYDLASAYFVRAAQDGVRRVEMFFDPQTHTERGVSYETVLEGLSRACEDARSRYGISSGLILCFLRHLSGEEAMRTLNGALSSKERLLGVGLDSSERGHPPSKFVEVFARARAEGLRAVAHAGEEGPPDYIRQALDLLKVERIDHGVRCLEDAELVARLKRDRVPLTVCPLSNVKLRVFETLGTHNLRRLLEAGLAASIHSDDPAYFGGYIGENFAAAQKALDLSADEVRTLARNSVEACFVESGAKRALLDEVDAFRL
ncbi:MAG: adenosine deaminase [Elusimicrobia bacterium CG_4_9_14_3_um_filter_62_55]|nr:MAG: adenosine deaminase [Elusimicrobia bacterium CG22_combo_CG10-13_8_21_14_all_63_91]PJA12729.1 MAG: adenosine deaminase [Elusimicrobia bacterium CG_4_10_14_0_2_um_filter_63_34]PJB24028.1 MAG: adenosine deaminase [Elusimicrobia bacterium CG_4_9_14_3_um_filter_62_55]